MEVTCTGCLRRLEECPKNKHGFPEAQKIFEVGNISKIEFGHRFYHTITGPTALCIVERRRNIDG